MIHFNSDTNYLGLAQNPQVQGLVPQRLSPPPFQMPITRPPVLLIDGLQIEGAQDPFLGFNNLLGCRKALYLLLLDCCKGYNSENSNERDVWGQLFSWLGTWSFHTLSGHTTLPAPLCVHQFGNSLNFVFRGFYVSSITKGWLIKISVIGD